MDKDKKNELVSSWSRNVIDEYKSLNDEEIRQKLREKSLPFAVAMEQWIGEFNFGTLIRNANAFGAKHIYYVGLKHFDKRGAVGVYNYSTVTHFKTILEFERNLRTDYSFIGFENIKGSVPLETFEWPKNPLMIFGEEGIGLTKEMMALCDVIVEIKQIGSVRSLNAACASAIAMYDFMTKLRNTNV